MSLDQLSTNPAILSDVASALMASHLVGNQLLDAYTVNYADGMDAVTLYPAKTLAPAPGASHIVFLCNNTNSTIGSGDAAGITHINLLIDGEVVETVNQYMAASARSQAASAMFVLPFTGAAQYSLTNAPPGGAGVFTTTDTDYSNVLVFQF